MERMHLVNAAGPAAYQAVPVAAPEAHAAQAAQPALAGVAADAAVAARAVDNDAELYGHGPMNIDRVMATLGKRFARVDQGVPPPDVPDELYLYSERYRFGNAATVVKRFNEAMEASARLETHFPAKVIRDLNTACKMALGLMLHNYEGAPHGKELLDQMVRVLDRTAQCATARSYAAKELAAPDLLAPAFDPAGKIAGLMQGYLHEVGALGTDPRAGRFGEIQALIDQASALAADIVGFAGVGISDEFVLGIQRLEMRADQTCRNLASDHNRHPESAPTALVQFRLARALERVIHEIHHLAMCHGDDIAWSPFP